MNKLNQDPAFRKSMVKVDYELNNILKSKGSIPKGAILTIPIVFHVLHYNGPENISDAQIYDALKILNRDFRLQNTDANLVQSEFQGMPSDAEIEFVLARKAPNGECFKGITRTENSTTFSGGEIGTEGTKQVNAIVAGNDVLNQTWPGNKYLNVFICANIGGLAGVTTIPNMQSATSMTNGIWILHNYLGSIGTSSEKNSRTLTHEVGHWLNLNHTWGPNNNPGNSASCSSDDDVSDTPNCIGVNSCLLNSNTCIDASNDKKDNIENYMEYSYCTKMFTQGQVDRMRASLQVITTGRFNIWQLSNLTDVGAFDTPTLCRAEFSSNKTTVCVGESVSFADSTYSMVNGWNWTFEGGTPAKAYVKNPITSYNTPGLYSVSLNASYGTKSNIETKTGYIRVLPISSSLPFYESFETYASLSNLTNWKIYNSLNNNAFELDNTRGCTGSKCVKLINFGENGSNIDELISAPVNLSKVSSNGNAITLSFRYAYRKKTSTDQEKLIVYVSNDCGDNWVVRKTISGTALSALTSSSTWAPSAKSDWTTIHMTNVNDAYWVNNFRYKFRFEGNGGNNIFLDDINIYYGAPSDNLVLGVSEMDEIVDLNLYPNPSQGEINLYFSIKEPQKTLVKISDFSGKQIDYQLINSESGANLVVFDTHKFASGIYLMTISTPGGQKVLHFTVN
jgi:PKD repeat protein